MKNLIVLIICILPLTSFAAKKSSEKQVHPEFSPLVVEEPDSVSEDSQIVIDKAEKTDQYTPVDFSEIEEKGVDGKLVLDGQDEAVPELKQTINAEEKAKLSGIEELKNLVIDDEPLKVAQKKEEKAKNATSNNVVAQGVDRNEIKSILRANLPNFSTCYNNELKRQKRPELVSGVINFKIIVKENGSVKRIEIYFSGVKTPKMDACMFNVIKKIKFPSFNNSKGIIEINQTIKLRPKKI